MQEEIRNIREILQSHWGYKSFRPMQEDIIRSVLEGKDTLALMPTGGGKSLCYQVPALARAGLCIVISPLIALMKDQVEQLRRKNITAFAIYSGMSRKEVINILKVAAGSNCKFLYLSPERLETSLFKEYLPALDINLIAVDEAHCIAQWGYDFRPPYLRIAALREQVPGCPVLALTASATPDVQDEICERLSFKEKNIFRQSFERPNLSFSVFRVDSKINRIIEILKNVLGSAIIYCKSRKRTQEIADLLRMHGMEADYYHAGLAADERSGKQDAWLQNRVRIMVCTNAFGMGIDKPDVRVVIHADIPDSIENYYQEAGRAGRDGKRSYAVLLYTESDPGELKESVSLRFPSIQDIQSIYQSACNYLQIPAGAPGGQYFDFDLTDFLKKFKLNGPLVLHSLKALEQSEWLSFSEQIFKPATVKFACGKEYLYSFEKSHTELEPVIKTLLRTYEGIFDFPVSVSENTLSWLMKREPGEMKKALSALHGHGIIEYMPQKDRPQIGLMRDRIKADDLTIDVASFNKRKENYINRVRQMTTYLLEGQECRSRLIAAYFGDNNVPDCGICDNCLARKKINLSRDEFEMIHKKILDAVQFGSVPAKQLLKNLHHISAAKAWKVLDYLQAEHKIEMDSLGRIHVIEPIR